MQSIALKNFLFATLWGLLGSKFNDGAHGLRCLDVEGLRHLVKFRFVYQAFGTRIVCICGSTSTKVGRFFTIQWRNENSRLKNPCNIIVAKMSFSLSWSLSNSCKNPVKNFLINFSFKLSKFQCLSCSVITWMSWVLNLVIVNIT